MSDFSSLVSVIIPVYHVGPWLRQCLDSVKEQTYPLLEVILIDDGSMDECGDICDEYAVGDTRFRVVHQLNRGLGNTRNVGMDLAHGKYIVFLDSDDYWKPDTVEQLVTVAEEHCLQVVVFSAEMLFDGVDPFPWPDYIHTAHTGEVLSGPEGMRIAREHREYYAQACLRFYLLSYLRENSLRFDEGIIHEDESFSLLAWLQANRMMCLEEKLYTRRFRKGSIMMSPDLLQSVEGYCTAMKSIALYSREHKFASDKLRLCADHMRACASAIFSIYAKTQHLPSSVAIAETAKKTFQEIRSGGYSFPLRFRIMISHFGIGYACWAGKRVISKILNSFRKRK